jgi:hypothetical protein
MISRTIQHLVGIQNYFIHYSLVDVIASISTIVATQKFAAIANIVRVNATELYVYRLRNYKDLETFLDEVSAVANKKTLLDIYNLAVNDQTYSFLYVNLTC